MISLWANCTSGFVLVLPVLSYECWYSLDPGAWSDLQGSGESQDLLRVLSRICPAAWTVCGWAGRQVLRVASKWSESRSEACLVFFVYQSLNKTSVLISLTMKPFTSDWHLNPHGWDSIWSKPMAAGFRTECSLGSWCLSAERIQWKAKWQVRNGFIQIQREAHSTDRVWAVAEGECGHKR